MSPERPVHWSRPRIAIRPTWGDLAFACLAVAAASGVALAVPYDGREPLNSIAAMLLLNPAAAFVRNVHFWAAQLFLLLSLAHVWDHLARATEWRVGRRVWLRLTLSIPVIGFLMLSGFMLKGDAEAQQAIRIVEGVLDGIPWLGRLLSIGLLGTAANRQVLYVHHVATATIFVWLVVAEHARAIWPRAVAVIESSLPIVALSAVLAPVLHDGLAGVVKGPWYFLGLQEMLHWTARPLMVVVAGVLFLVVFVGLPRCSDRTARAIKVGLVGATVGYAGLVILAAGFRGEGWRFEPAWTGSIGLVWQSPASWRLAGEALLHGEDVPTVLGRREGCLVCHRGVSGLSASHRADAVGCASCHGGNPFSLEKTMAHRGLVRIPGNLADAARSCGTAACHPSQVDRVPRSLMTTMAGVIAVDRSVFGQRPDEPVAPHVDRLETGGADSHLRQLCASCHIGATKTSFGPVGGRQSRWRL